MFKTFLGQGFMPREWEERWLSRQRNFKTETVGRTQRVRKSDGPKMKLFHFYSLSLWYDSFTSIKWKDSFLFLSNCSEMSEGSNMNTVLRACEHSCCY